MTLIVYLCQSFELLNRKEYNTNDVFSVKIVVILET
jgi:hypothetical protein